MNEDNTKDEGRKAEESIGLTVQDLPVELLSKVLSHLTDAKDIVSVQLVNKKFRNCASWDGVRGICFILGSRSKGRGLSMRSGTADFEVSPWATATAEFRNFRSESLQIGILRSFWKHCEKLEEIEISRALSGFQMSLSGSVSNVRRLLSAIGNLQEDQALGNELA